ncbi:hypothetical protein C0584_04610 [Candidatus Parcubacteria bacterium]|nr:MAG: hypothetical protein C0584_04610 [Candidatus Parcubacteria bacterium]
MNERRITTAEEGLVVLIFSTISSVLLIEVFLLPAYWLILLILFIHSGTLLISYTAPVSDEMLL